MHTATAEAMNVSTFSRTAYNLMNMGYYPTTKQDAELIASYLSGYHYTMLDPCCGTAEAIHTISEFTKGYPTSLIGIELEEKRAEKAKTSLDMLIHDDFFNIHIEAGSIGCVFLNPPYFSDEKLHDPFIEKTTTMLCKKGILILMIPEYELENNTANFISTHYENIRVLRSTEEKFQQIILLGVKRSKPILVTDSRLCYEAKNAKTITPLTDSKYDFTKANEQYPIPQTKNANDIKITSKAFSPEELGHVLQNFTEDWRRIKMLVPEISSTKRPLLPLRRGHLAQILAAGAIDGIIIDEETKEKFLIKGTTQRVEEVVEESEELKRLIYRDVVTILMLDETGILQKIYK